MDTQLRRRAIGPPAARSTLLTILGEFVLHERGGVWQETLVKSLIALDYSSAAARRAVARSISDGSLVGERHGRRSRVTLSPTTEAMLVEGAERIYGFGADRAWDGHWLFAMLRVSEDKRDVRHRLRTRLAWAGFGSLGAGIWICPHAEREDEVATMAADEPDADLVTFRAEIGAVGEPRRLVESAWALDKVATGYRTFIEGFEARDPRGPEEAFCAQVELVHGWRRFPFLDPELPEHFLPDGWPGEEGRRLFEARHEEWAAAAQDYFASLSASAG